MRDTLVKLLRAKPANRGQIRRGALLYVVGCKRIGRELDARVRRNAPRPPTDAYAYSYTLTTAAANRQCVANETEIKFLSCKGMSANYAIGESDMEPSDEF